MVYLRESTYQKIHLYIWVPKCLYTKSRQTQHIYLGIWTCKTSLYIRVSIDTLLLRNHPPPKDENSLQIKKKKLPRWS